MVLEPLSISAQPSFEFGVNVFAMNDGPDNYFLPFHLVGDPVIPGADSPHARELAAERFAEARGFGSQTGSYRFNDAFLQATINCVKIVLDLGAE